MRLPRLPLFVQTLGLIIISLVVAQALSVLVILSLPPPPPLVYTVAEVANVVRPDTSARADPRHLLMTRIATHPPVGLTTGSRRAHFREALSRALAIPPSSIVVAQLGTKFVVFGVRKPRILQREVQRELLLDAPEPLLMGSFEIGIRRADGKWLLVSPRSTFGIDAWQMRLFIVLALSGLAVAPLSWLFSRRIAAPIAALAAGAERLGRDPGAPPLPLRGSAEVSSAAAAFNEMQARLRKYIDERTGMLGAIAHDLRTPLTRVRFRVEGIAEPLRTKLINDIDQMEAMVASTLSFIHDTSQPHDRRKLEVASLVETVMDEASLTGADAAVESAERVVIDGDPLALKRLFVNLVDNALKFGSTARARVTTEGDLAVIEVEDDGPGVPECEIERIFEPFHRVEVSRSRETGGIGLGLSVVRAVARGHGGDVVLRNRPTGGLNARVTLPLASVAKA
jgi:signal transduction histidine kinase